MPVSPRERLLASEASQSSVTSNLGLHTCSANLAIDVHFRHGRLVGLFYASRRIDKRTGPIEVSEDNLKYI
ncbi:hypothetical protein PUN4_700055 [Paraburkholderia unamae]|nr:hypothetical protein PUN4_700055 [Paraburkholderia unamae]